MIDALDEISRKIPVIFPVHPRTQQMWADRLKRCSPGLRTMPPMGYLDFLALQKNARFVITDSGGIQEETTWLGIPCMTLRENTERPITITVGTNELIGNDWLRLRESVNRILTGNWKSGSCPPLWDGHASDRIADLLTLGRSAQMASAAEAGLQGARNA
jgi:UDP-N-acetylglucosamine 2-epimerase (non-hydrolysing)